MGGVLGGRSRRRYKRVKRNTAFLSEEVTIANHRVVAEELRRLGAILFRAALIRRIKIVNGERDVALISAKSSTCHVGHIHRYYGHNYSSGAY